MSGQLALLQPSGDPAHLLSGGRSPACWHREVSRLTKPLSALHRSCNWHEPLIDAHPYLCEKPLLGHSLSAVLESGPILECALREEPRTRSSVRHDEHPCKVAEERIEPRVLSSSRRESSCSPVRHNADARAQHTAMIATAGAQCADRGLLCRLAGEQANVTSDQQKPPRSIEPQLRCGVAKPAPVEREQSARALLDCVSPRAKRVLHKFTLPDGCVAVGHVATSESETPARLTDQYSISVEGRRAPAQLLTQLSTIDVRKKKTAESNSDDPLRATNRSEDANFETRPPTNRDRATHIAKRVDRQRDPTHPAETSPEARGLAVVQGLRRAGARDRSQPQLLPINPELSLSVDEGDTVTLPGIVPPAMTTLLPSLKAPATTTSPILPVAAATARISARQSEQAARAEDLSLLAEQINRILNEEARRHGIDV